MAEKFFVEKLTNDNYDTWKFRMELLLMKNKVWSVIRDAAPAVISVEWTEKDEEARALIGLSVDDNQLWHIRNLNTAKEAWDALKSYHQKATLSTKVFLLKRICRMTVTEDGDVEAHISQMQDLVNRLIGLGEVLKDNMIAALMLGSLPDSYGVLITSLESRPENDLTLSLVKGKIIDEYKRRKNCGVYTAENEAAMRVQMSGRGKNFTCFFCKKNGHMKRNCPEYTEWKRKKEAASKANHVTDTDAEDLCNVVRAHVESLSENKYTEVKIDKCLKVKTQGKEKVWILDSGATSHMACSEKSFIYIDYKKRGYVSLADEDVRREIQGIGKCVVKCILSDGKIQEITLDNVLYVPRLSSNLIYIKRLAIGGHKIVLEGVNCNIYKDGVLKAIVKPYGDLYELMTAEKALVTTIKTKVCSENCIHSWHRRFGHRSLSAIKGLVEKTLATGIIIKDCGNITDICECCVKGKMTRKPFPSESSNKTQRPLDLVHTDVCGPMQTATPGNKRYVLTIIDDFSRYTKIYLMETKDQVTSLIINYVETAKTLFSKKPKTIRSDRGKEYVNNTLQDYLRNQGIETQLTVAYSPQQNGVAERKNRSLMEMARCMLIDAGMHTKYWGEAVSTANYLQNRLPTKVTEKTPFELWYSKIPDVGDLKVFGCEGYSHIPKEKRRKLDEKARKLTFVGYSKESKGFRLLDKNTDKIIISRDVVFLNEKIGDCNGEIPRLSISDVKEKNEGAVSVRKGDEKEKEVKKGDAGYIEVYFNAVKEKVGNGIREVGSQHEDQEGILQIGEVREAANEDLNSVQPVRRSARSNKGVPPDMFIARAKLVTEEPRTREEALSGPDRAKWQKAMDEEMESLLRNNTWEIVPAPPDSNIVSNKWVFKIKKDSQGQIERYKARLVARGFSQKYGTDYDQVFSPVVRHTTFRVFLTIAGQLGMVVKHYDAKTAFLNGELKEIVFMEQPEGYTVPGKEDMVYRLVKGLYGLRQASKVWNDHLVEILQLYGFVQSLADPCLYMKITIEEIIYVVVYVDDLLISGKTIEQVESTAENFNKHFLLKDLGNVKHYLGMQIEREGKVFSICQENYIEQVLRDTGLQDANISKIPLDTGYVKTRTENGLMPNSSRYQKLIGALLYIAVNTRPDIAASVTILSQYNKQPSPTDWTEAKGVLCYLKGTKGKRLKLSSDDTMDQLIGYAVADWAENRSDRKSNSGYVFQLYGGAISWGCRKQNCVSLSSTEAEYVALAEASQEAVWIIRLLNDLSHDNILPVTIFEDNQSCLKMIQNRKHSHRTKHIDTKYYYVNDLYENKTIAYTYCPTEDMLADLMTKPLKEIKLKIMMERCELN